MGRLWQTPHHAKGAATIAFTYGPGRNRFKRVDTNNTGITTTHYVGGKAYENINRNGSIERKHYLAGGAVFTDYVTAGLSKTRYLHKDHLGSVDAITDEAGIVVERMSFDAFGKRRDPDWVPVNDPTGYLSPDTTRGYTGHEQIDPVGLIHMNGRVYDPEIGRFSSEKVRSQNGAFSALKDLKAPYPSCLLDVR